MSHRMLLARVFLLSLSALPGIGGAVAQPGVTTDAATTIKKVSQTAVWAPANAAQHKALSNARRVDALFAKWASPTSPGAAVAVMQNGKIIYSHGYGMASLEYGVPNTPTTVFDVASLSKQFTAFAVLLLAQEGKLSLDDNIRKYLPEMHDFGTPITIRELLHHTSGLRDQWGLLHLAGWRHDDVITEQDVLDLLWRQKELNFAPGEQMLYSNTGYTLLALIVTRVSGVPFSQFTQLRIFQPLGMAHTHFQDEYGNVIKNRAYSYDKDQDGAYKYVALSYSTVGPTGLFTDIEDMAKWDENFYTGKVGGKDLIADLQLQGKLNSGRQISYADGLNISRCRGLKTVSHDGGDAGYRAYILRFPDQHFSVIVLSNTGNMDPDDISYNIADVYLAGYLGPKLGPVSAETPSLKTDTIDPKLTPDQLKDLAGEYYSEELAALFVVRAKDGHLSVRYPQGELDLRQTAADQYVAELPIGTLKFTRASDGASNGFTISVGRVRDLRFDKVTIAPTNLPMPKVPARKEH